MSSILGFDPPQKYALSIANKGHLGSRYMYSQEVQANQPLHLVVIIYIVDHPKKTSLKHLTWSIFGREPLTHLQKLLQHEVDKPYIYPRCSMYGLFTYKTG